MVQKLHFCQLKKTSLCFYVKNLILGLPYTKKIQIFFLTKGSVCCMRARVRRFVLTYSSSGGHCKSPRDSMPLEESPEQEEEDPTYHRWRGGHGPECHLWYGLARAMGAHRPGHDVGPASEYGATGLHVAVPAALRERCHFADWGAKLSAV